MPPSNATTTTATTSSGSTSAISSPRTISAAGSKQAQRACPLHLKSAPPHSGTKNLARLSVACDWSGLRFHHREAGQRGAERLRLARPLKDVAAVDHEGGDRGDAV